MGNRRKPRNPLARMESGPLFDPNDKVDVPIQEKSVHKRVPAVIHWAQVDGTDRDDDETIGEAIIYEDGTSDVIVFNEITDEAKRLVGIINSRLDHYSIED